MTSRPPRDAETARSGRSVLVWDLPTRLFHWCIVVLVAAAYVTDRLNWLDWHVRAGEALLALLVFRLLWGIFGSETARFRSFLASPAAGLRHLAHLFRREPDHEVGHNAAGGLMVLLMLALLLGLTLTGLYVNDQVSDNGPLLQIVPAPVSNAITDLHGWLWDVLLAAVALHVLAIAAYAAAKGQNLVRAMLTGRKTLPLSVPSPRVAGLGLALLLLGVGVAVTALIATFL